MGTHQPCLPEGWRLRSNCQNAKRIPLAESRRGIELYHSNRRYQPCQLHEDSQFAPAPQDLPIRNAINRMISCGTKRSFRANGRMCSICWQEKFLNSLASRDMASDPSLRPPLILPIETDSNLTRPQFPFSCAFRCANLQ